MNRVGKVKVVLHSDRAEPSCSCGIREWEIYLPGGWTWLTPWVVPRGRTFEETMEFARTLNPETVGIIPSGYPDTWVLSQKLSEATKAGSTSRTPTAVDTPSYN
jgi:hypothetical protein